jgi:hypothetical protein
MNDTGTHDVEAAPAPRRPWWHWRRLTRGRLRPALAAVLAGALLGSLGTAWQSETGPFADDRACWGALTENDVAALFRGKTDIETSEIPVTVDSIGSEGPSGQCLLHSPRGHRITVQVHKLDARFAGAGDQWADEFLSARMTPLGSGLLGMASDTRAWGAIPDSCTRRPDKEGPVVIDMETGWTVYDDEVDAAERDRLARAVVRLVNGYMRSEGCEGSVPDGVDRMPKPPRFNDERADAICGIEGLRSTAVRKTYLDRPLVTRGEGPVRTCDRDVLFDHPGLRLMTVEDPRLSVLYESLAFDGGKEIRTAEGHGFVRRDLGLFQAECETGDVTFLVRARNGRHPEQIRSLLPRYVAKEADRIGCGPLRITLTD